MKKLSLVLIPMLILLISSCNKVKTAPPINDHAALPSLLNPDRLGLEVVTIYYDKKNGTISTLYGNKKAYLSAVDSIVSHKAGEIYMMVTWKEIDNEQWFGAKIPGKAKEIEVVKVVASAEGHTQTKYERYSGKKLALVTDVPDEKQRSEYILSRRASILP